MVYESVVVFTMDTVCPWTYLAKRRLDRAITQFKSTSPLKSSISFKIQLASYQLAPDMPEAGASRSAWYLNNRFGGDSARLAMMQQFMKAKFAEDGIQLEYPDHAVVANTLQAHRVLQYVQAHVEELTTTTTAEKGNGNDLPSSVLENLYAAYFTHGAHPASSDTLTSALTSAGLNAGDAARIVDDKQLYLRDTQSGIREQVGNGVDSVPVVVVQGKRRDLTLVGAREVAEYLKALEQVAEEAK